MTRFSIQVTSDTVCPWCFVGKRRLDAAIAQYQAKHGGDDDDAASFDIEWRPFYLNPDAPRGGMDKRDFYRQKFGELGASRIQERLSTMGVAEQIRFRAGGRTGSTRDSHRLLALARSVSSETQLAVVEQLFQAYFEQERDITSHSDLRAAAVAGGLDGGVVDDVLSSDRFGGEVDGMVQEAYQDGVSGVPRFVINESFELSGAQDPAVILSLFERIKAGDEARVGGVSSGNAC